MLFRSRPPFTEAAWWPTWPAWDASDRRSRSSPSASRRWSRTAPRPPAWPCSGRRCRTLLSDGWGCPTASRTVAWPFPRRWSFPLYLRAEHENHELFGRAVEILHAARTGFIKNAAIGPDIIFRHSTLCPYPFPPWKKRCDEFELLKICFHVIENKIIRKCMFKK